MNKPVIIIIITVHAMREILFGFGKDKTRQLEPQHGMYIRPHRRHVQGQPGSVYNGVRHEPIMQSGIKYHSPSV